MRRNYGREDMMRYHETGDMRRYYEGDMMRYFEREILGDIMKEEI